MRRLSSLVYLLVFLLVSGYYYYFEVVQKKQKEMAATEARKVFSFQSDSVSALTIEPKGKETIQLKKDGEWEIVQPIKADADKFSVSDFINALSRLEAEREAASAPDDLKPFGLLEPSLIVSFQAGEQKLELLVGDKNPLGDGHYAKTADKTRVFLIAEGNYSVLNKGLNELRRRQLFTFQLDDVAAVNVVWHDENSVTVELDSGGKGWKSPTNPEVTLKKSKIDNMIEQIHWLRVQAFLENEPKDLPALGLEPPFVTITLRLKTGEDVDLKLASKKKDEKQIAALSSQLPSTVEVAANILDDLPKDLLALQDRSLLGIKPDDIKQVIWSMADSRGHVVQLDENRWGSKKGENTPEAIKDSRNVRSLLWDLGDTEYQTKLAPAQPIVPEPYCRIDLRDAERNLLTLSWDKLPQEGRNPVPVWVQREGENVVVGVDAELLRRIEGDLARLGPPDKKE